MRGALLQVNGCFSTIDQRTEARLALQQVGRCSGAGAGRVHTATSPSAEAAPCKYATSGLLDTRYRLPASARGHIHRKSAGKLQIQLGEGRGLLVSKDPEARQLRTSGLGGDTNYVLAEESSGVLQTSGATGPRCGAGRRQGACTAWSSSHPSKLTSRHGSWCPSRASGASTPRESGSRASEDLWYMHKHVTQYVGTAARFWRCSAVSQECALSAPVSLAQVGVP
jgi:hypothetical protein